MCPCYSVLRSAKANDEKTISPRERRAAINKELLLHRLCASLSLDDATDDTPEDIMLLSSFMKNTRLDLVASGSSADSSDCLLDLLNIKEFHSSTTTWGEQNAVIKAPLVALHECGMVE